VKEFARGCMRSYLILKEKAQRWNADKEIQALLKESAPGGGSFGRYSKDASKQLLAKSFDRAKIAARGLYYERLDQLTMEVLWGVR
jgi:xylose isomerase